MARGATRTPTSARGEGRTGKHPSRLSRARYGAAGTAAHALARPTNRPC